MNTRPLNTILPHTFLLANPLTISCLAALSSEKVEGPEDTRLGKNWSTVLLIRRWRDRLLSRGIREVIWVKIGPGLFTRSPAVGVALNLLRQLRGSLSSSNGILSGILLSDATSLVQLHICNVTVVVDLSVNLLLVVDVDVWSSEGENGAYY